MKFLQRMHHRHNNVSVHGLLRSVAHSVYVLIFLNFLRKILRRAGLGSTADNCKPLWCNTDGVSNCIYVRIYTTGHPRTGYYFAVSTPSDALTDEVVSNVDGEIFREFEFDEPILDTNAILFGGILIANVADESASHGEERYFINRMIPEVPKSAIINILQAARTGFEKWASRYPNLKCRAMNNMA